MTIVRVLGPADPAADRGPARESSLAALVAECGFDRDPETALECLETYYETFDGRLRAVDATLVHRAAEDAWRLEVHGSTAHTARGGRLPGDGRLAKEVRRLVKGRGLIPYLAVRRRERRFRHVPAASEGQEILLRWQELRFLDLRERREVAGPRIIRLEANTEDVAGGPAALLLSRLEGISTGNIDILAVGCRALGLPIPGEPTPDAWIVGAADPLLEALHKILAREAWNLRRHVRGALLDLDVEYVHQLRVSSRRARAALRAFRGRLEGSSAAALRGELDWLGETLGRARDLDVLLEGMAKHCRRAMLDEPTTNLVTEAFRRRRRAAFEDAARALTSRRFNDLLSAMDAFRAPLPEGETEASIGAMAPRLLEKAIRRIEKWRRRGASDLADADLHRIRIAFKRLRYLGEFFSDFQVPAFSESLRTLVRFQDCLGALNDAEVAERYFRDAAEALLADRRPDPAPALAYGALCLVQRRRKAKQRGRFLELWDGFPGEARRLRKRIFRTPPAPNPNDETKP